jgi:hypothetical protein
MGFGRLPWWLLKEKERWTRVAARWRGARVGRPGLALACEHVSLRVASRRPSLVSFVWQSHLLLASYVAYPTPGNYGEQTIARDEHPCPVRDLDVGTVDDDAATH